MFGPIAVTYNVNGVNSLKLDGPTLAKIFNGSITTWDDPAIKALNPGTNLPRDAHPRRLPQRPIRRHVQFQQYLDAASDGAWGKGAGQTFHGGVGDGGVGR